MSIINVYRKANGFEYSIDFEADSANSYIVNNSFNGIIEKVESSEGVSVYRGATLIYDTDSLNTSFNVSNGDSLRVVTKRSSSSTALNVKLIAINFNEEINNYTNPTIPTNASDFFVAITPNGVTGGKLLLGNTDTNGDNSNVFSYTVWDAPTDFRFEGCVYYDILNCFLILTSQISDSWEYGFLKIPLATNDPNFLQLVNLNNVQTTDPSFTKTGFRGSTNNNSTTGYFVYIRHLNAFSFQQNGRPFYLEYDFTTNSPTQLFINSVLYTFYNKFSLKGYNWLGNLGISRINDSDKFNMYGDYFTNKLSVLFYDENYFFGSDNVLSGYFRIYDSSLKSLAGLTTTGTNNYSPYAQSYLDDLILAIGSLGFSPIDYNSLSLIGTLTLDLSHYSANADCKWFIPHPTKKILYAFDSDKDTAEPTSGYDTLSIVDLTAWDKNPANLIEGTKAANQVEVTDITLTNWVGRSTRSYKGYGEYCFNI